MAGRVRWRSVPSPAHVMLGRGESPALQRWNRVPGRSFSAGDGGSPLPGRDRGGPGRVARLWNVRVRPRQGRTDWPGALDLRLAAGVSRCDGQQRAVRSRIAPSTSCPWIWPRHGAHADDVGEPGHGWRPGDHVFVDLPDGQTVRCRVVNVEDDGTIQVVPDHAVVIQARTAEPFT